MINGSAIYPIQIAVISHFSAAYYEKKKYKKKRLPFSYTKHGHRMV